MVAIEMTAQDSNRRFRRRFISLMTLYALSCFAVPVAIKAWALAGPVVWLLAAIPAVLVTLGVASWAVNIRQSDEFLRRVQLDAIMVGVAVTGFLTVLWGFFEFFTNAPHINPFFVGPIFFASYGLAMPFILRRYR